MHRRIVVAVAALLFFLLAVVANVLTDLHDRTYPESLDTSSTLNLDFSQTGLTDQAAFGELAALSDRWNLRLVKVLPDLTGDQSGQIFVPMGSGVGLPDDVRWYGEQTHGRVKQSSVLEHSFATGTYLVTGDPAHLDEFEKALTARGTQVRREDDSLRQGIRLGFSQGAFRTTLVAGAALMVSLALYWLTVKARGRALRVLGGVPVSRIHVEDLGGFLLAMVVAAVAVTSVATCYVGMTHGWLFAPYYVQTLIQFQVAVILITMAVAVGISLTSWPSAALLASRRPAIQGLHKASTVLKAATFLFVISTVGPVWIAYTDAASVAAQQAQWRSLADQVVLRYPGALGESGFQALTQDIGEVVRAAEERGDVAMSYALTQKEVPGANFDSFDAFALVNQRWLDLMLKAGTSGALQTVSIDRVPSGISDYMVANLPVWARTDGKDASLARFRIYQTKGSIDVPLAAGGNGELIFPNQSLILVAPDLFTTFNDDFLASLTSTNNLVFAGLEPTMRLLTAKNLQRTIQVKYASEDGVLRAQFTKYLAWLRGASLAGLLVAFAVAAGISAFISASLHAQRNFPMRLSGNSWAWILAPLLAREWAGGIVLTGIVALMEPVDTLGFMSISALTGLMLLTLSHLASARWHFANMTVRRL